MTSRIAITPETKVGALLDAYPELEPVLVQIAPAFEKLRNPVLRRTIARVTSLATAARVGAVDVRVMVRTLRNAAGLEAGAAEDDALRSDASTAVDDTPAPAWANGPIRTTIDADAVLALERTPLQEVMPKLRSLGDGELLLVRSSFRPEPLLVAVREAGNEVYCRAVPAGGFETVIRGRAAREHR